jgi:hypothetical protein
MNYQKKKPIGINTRSNLSDVFSSEIPASNRDITVNIIVTTISIILTIIVLILVSIIYNNTKDLNDGVTLGMKFDSPSPSQALFSPSDMMYFLNSCVINCENSKVKCDENLEQKCEEQENEKGSNTSLLVICYRKCVNDFNIEGKRIRNL